MTPAATSTLITQVELALLAGRNLDQIESEILESREDDEELRAAAWLYAWSCTDGRPLATFACSEGHRNVPVSVVEDRVAPLPE
jgi:hypothetical protein